MLLALPSPSALVSAEPLANRPAVNDIRKDDPDRKAVLDALRPAIERDLGQKVIFVVHRLRRAGAWAFADVAPRTSAGAPIDFTRTHHAERLREGMLDDDIVYALLRRRAGGWIVVTFAVGPTDVPWDGWDEEYGAPPALFAPTD